MARKLLLIIICISFNLLRGQDENTTTYGILPTDIPTHTLVKYNRFYFNPTFSLVRENKKSINVYNKTQWASFNDNPQTYLINYTSNFDEKIGVSIGLHQQNEGIYRYFGGIANFAYNIELNRDMNFTFGLNLGFSQSGIKSNIDSATSIVLNNGVEVSDPVILNYENSSVFQLTPGVNFNYAEFDVGVSVSNLVAYNLTGSELLTDNMAFTGHVMYTTSLERRSDKIIRGMAYANMLPDSGADSNLRYGGNVIVELPALGWAQAGYNSFYGASLGIGGNITSNISVGYTYETGFGDTSNFGASHEVGLAYNFEKERPRRRRGSRSKSSTQKAYEERDSEIRRLKKEILEQNKLIRELQEEQGDSRSQEQKAMSELEKSIAEAREKEAKAARELELQRAEEVKLLNKKAEEERLAAQRRVEREEAEQNAEEERLAAQRRIEREEAEQNAEEERLAAQRRIEREEAEQKAEEERLAAQRQIEREVAEQKAAEERIAAEEAAREAEAAEQERLAAQKELEREEAEQKAEEERLAAQKQLEREVAEQKIEEERLAAQKQLEREVAEQKIADEAAEVARLAEEKRLADEAAEAARLAEEKRLADEAAAEAARLAEEKRLADEAAAEAARLAEEKRLADEAAAEAARLAEEKRLADEAAEAARLAEEKRLADEAAAEAARLAEEKRLADEAAEAARLAEEKRLADEAAAEAARLAEEKRLADEAAAEAARLAEEKRLADEAAAEAARLAEEKRLADEAAAEAARLAEEKRLADEAAAEAARLAEEKRLADEAAKAAATANEEGLDEIKKELDNSSRITSKIFARRDSLLTTSLNVDKREFSKLLESLVSMNDDADEAKKEADPASSKRLTARNRFVKFAETTRPEAQIATKFIPGYPEGYYLIGNVFKGGTYADKFSGTLKDLGFNDSKIILNPENQFQYVAIESYTNKDEAIEKYLNNIDNRYFGDMWILHIAKSRVESYKKLLQETRLIKDTVKDDTVLTESLSYIGGHNIENGYYLITNIFKRENYFERGMAKLRAQGLEPQYFRNPKDNYIYVYLKRHDNLEEAKQSLFSNVNNSYDGDLYILKIQ
ncbi:type IX secretion system PorP/SprF family membrane protein [Aquimarina sp. EL_43]|uniref:PorP/SprF family type IX secretion system membrane protein n=1 Tax=unclassified Aquimarina TaxID=2627091 RepID=UPI0018CBC7FA|nr:MULTISPECIES: PorP/SprF family type IX secretion system membrane protein [unclassified Aquimarina]MBG6131739.1 type IX secretion system PorP/SprF family membrane protein [Aquimarina sp. EL_35]MBG6152200.1 type IX secretion system PorP/SprF family membrane protein [Aquimarina sp. EL_32]MBG6169856.1 type IX secretion system PorP/SprF family membrane protein [Aquimarina sp. EL_43]